MGVPSSVQPPPPSRLASALSVPDFILRLAYFLVIPFAILGIALKFPVTGALVNIVIALVFFLLGAFIRPRVEKRPLVARLLRRQLAFEAYYRANTPRPFLYYVFYPLLFPYWLISTRARQEFMLFRGYTVLNLVILVGTSVYQYFTKWLPDLGFGPFMQGFFVVALIESFFVLGVLMPVATTIIGYHVGHKHKRLYVLLLAAALTTVLAFVGYMKKRHEVVPYLATLRMSLRTQAAPHKSKRLLGEALRLAWVTVMTSKGQSAEFSSDWKNEVEIAGLPLDKARGVLTDLYKDDETHAFHLVAFDDKKKGKQLVLYGDPGNPKQPLVWIGLHGKGELFDDPKMLADGAIAKMRKTSEK